MSNKPNWWKRNGLALWKWESSFVLGAVVVVVLLSILGGVGVQAWNRSEADKSYAAVVGACITGAVTLIGITVATFVLRFQIKSQATPLMVELFKRQCDSVNSLNKAASDLYGMTSSDRGDLKADDKRIAFIEKWLKLYSAYSETMHASHIWCSFSLSAACVAYSNSMDKWREAFLSDVNIESLKNLEEETTQRFYDIMNECRAAVHMFELKEGTAKIAAVLHRSQQ